MFSDACLASLSVTILPHRLVLGCSPLPLDSWQYNCSASCTWITQPEGGKKKKSWVIAGFCNSAGAAPCSCSVRSPGSRGCRDGDSEVLPAGRKGQQRRGWAGLRQAEGRRVPGLAVLCWHGGRAVGAAAEGEVGNVWAGKPELACSSALILEWVKGQAYFNKILFFHG